MARPQSNEAVPTRETLIERARALVPALRERAEETEARRSLPEASHRDFLESGLYRMYLPQRFGGYESDVMLQVDVSAEIGRGCGSSAWVLSILASHSWVHGMMDARAQDDVWGDDPDIVIASSFPTPAAKCDVVDGGFVLNGRWVFSSGIDQSDWNHFNVMTPRPGDGVLEHRFMAVPKSDFEVVDDWFTTGLRGTGSKGMMLKDVFVPDYRTIRSETCLGVATPGSAVNPGPLYRMPLFALFGKGIVGPALGAARGALELVTERLRPHASSVGEKVADQPTVHLRIAEAAAEIDAAWALLKRDAEQAQRMAEDGVQPDLEQRVRWRRNDCFAGNLCMRAVERLYPLQGGGGLSEKSPIQRAWRDVHAICSHIGLTWDVQGSNYGRVYFGGKSQDPKL